MVEVVDDLVGHFAESAVFGVHEDVGLAVVGFAGGEERADGREGIGTIEEGAVGLVAGALPDGFGGGPEADDEGVFFQAGEVGGVDDEAAAGGDDAVGTGFEIADEVGFELAKDGFSVFGEDAGDGFVGAFFEEFIGVEKGEAEVVGDMVADGGFAGAHETDEGKVADGGSGFVHRGGVADRGAAGTPIRWEGRGTGQG